MAGRQQEARSVQPVVVERLHWQSAGRADAAVAGAIYQGAELDTVYRLEEAGLLDEFYAFLEAVGVVDLIWNTGGAIRAG